MPSKRYNRSQYRRSNPVYEGSIRQANEWRVFVTLSVKPFEERGNHTGGKGSSLNGLHVEIPKVVSINESISTSWGTIPRNPPPPSYACLDSKPRIEGLAGNHELLMFYSLCNQGTVGLGGGRIDSRFISAVPVNPAPRGGRRKRGHLRASRSVDHSVSGGQQ
ncbi:hypothetical protein BDM02DRAFT_3130835 [Thelephora ganbajun]|uniref:Uncharacterized protein n=1 Tax=Thelephora ganbajun TaxID=370292 RepID=A0ACB6Z823_THEGA|nr:hypothetical protein BDM02DRAFT_3130835 [Thelephora ganbajun]